MGRGREGIQKSPCMHGDRVLYTSLVSRLSLSVHNFCIQPLNAKIVYKEREPGNEATLYTCMRKEGYSERSESSTGRRVQHFHTNLYTFSSTSSSVLSGGETNHHICMINTRHGKHANVIVLVIMLIWVV